MRILIVEDHKDAAELLSKTLSRKIPRAECLIARNLRNGLEQAVTFSADITLLDLVLPDSTPEETIRAIPSFPPPVVVITDLDDDEHRIEMLCYAHGAQNFFTKAELRSRVFTEEGDKLVNAIIKAHWRNVLPQQQVKIIHDEAVRSATASHHGTHV